MKNNRTLENFMAGLCVIAPFPVIAASGFYGLMRMFRVRWYYPLAAAVVGGILVAIRPGIALVSGSGYVWYLLFHLIFRNAPSGFMNLFHPLRVQMPGTAPVLLSSSPFHFPQLHLPGLPSYFMGWKVTYSVVTLMLLFGGLVACIAALRKPAAILTSEERQDRQQKAGSRWTDYLVRRAERRERRNRGGGQ